MATRQRNKQSKARGEPQTHGKVGKTRKRAEEKAALETLQERQQQSSVRDERGSGDDQWGQRERERGGALADELSVRSDVEERWGETSAGAFTAERSACHLVSDRRPPATRLTRRRDANLPEKTQAVQRHQ